MTLEEWVEEYKSEIWIPTAKYDGTQVVRTKSMSFHACQPVRLMPSGDRFEWFLSSGGYVECEEIVNKSEFIEHYTPLMPKEKQSSITYRIREMLIPDDSFVKGRMCLGIIAAPDNAGTDESRIYCEEFYNTQFDSYFRDEEIFHNLIHFMSQWIWHVKSYWRKEPTENPFLVPFDKRYGGVYISSRDTVVEFEYQDGKNPVFQISNWATDYFEQANKKKEDIKNENQ